ncbi:hypothetical protein V1264_008579 [Littorina saxatilis]|uniref:Uncharacterized protein n=1 Tax=Littorina saxatilis TaxID=31220 RepID=A0AAN9ATC5_9CAEN
MILVNCLDKIFNSYTTTKPQKLPCILVRACGLSFCNAVAEAESGTNELGLKQKKPTFCLTTSKEGDWSLEIYARMDHVSSNTCNALWIQPVQHGLR